MVLDPRPNSLYYGAPSIDNENRIARKDNYIHKRFTQKSDGSQHRIKKKTVLWGSKIMKKKMTPISKKMKVDHKDREKKST